MERNFEQELEDLLGAPEVEKTSVRRINMAKRRQRRTEVTGLPTLATNESVPTTELKNISPQKGPQTDFLTTAADVAIYGGAAGGGKLLPLDEVLVTPSGYVTMGDVKVGTELFDESGDRCRVTHLFAIDPKPVLYRLTFDDGTTVDACKDHQWHTYTAKDLSRLTRQTDQWRAKRRASRPSRALSETSKSEVFMAAPLKRNQTIKSFKDVATGSVKTTQEIVDTLYVGKSNRLNHAVQVAGVLDLPEKEFPLDPYLLGLWLGDGTSTTGVVTSADEEIVKDWVRIPSSKYGYRIPGLTVVLKAMGLLGNKHVPADYLRGSPGQRLALLQGLMDTDGTVTGRGQPEFDNTNEALVDAVIELACSLGHKPGRKTSRRAILNGKDCGLVYSVKWCPKDIVFRLARKEVQKQKVSVRRVTSYRYIVSAELIESRPGRCISVDSPSRLYLATRRMVPTHNSYALLLEPLRHFDNPKFGGVIFRRNSVQVRNQGGLWDESTSLYHPLGAHPREAYLDWTFPGPNPSEPNGMSVKFAHLELDRDVHNWQGAQIPYIGFDELCHFSEYQFFYMFSRNRSVSGVPGYIRATCNPDADSWVRKLIDWYIGSDGYPIKERSGAIRWFIRMDDTIIWADSPGELKAMYGEEHLPKSFTFIPSSVHDNKILLDKDPAYLANLRSLSRVERERLLNGNWNIKASAGNVFRREWFTVYDAVPAGWVSAVRYWDRAATKPSETNRDPDWTRGLLMYRYANGQYLVGDLRSMRDTPGQVEKFVKAVASHDGPGVKIMSQRDPGSAGVGEAHNFVSMLAGYVVETETLTQNKLTRAAPVSAQVEVGNIYVLRAPWNEDFFKETENFPEGAHDDIVDVLSGAFNALANRNTFIGIT